VSVAVIYGLLWPNRSSPDLAFYLFPWLDHIRSAGPVAAFAAPFSNYTPPYLYLLSAASLLGLSDLATVKLVAVGAVALLSVAVWRLLRALGSDSAADGAVVALLLPTVVLNGPMLGQCDALWAAPCLMAVAAAVERRPVAMATWAGLAFAVKAQAAFIAPFALVVIARDRKWPPLLIPPAIYFLMVAPAWAAGWPIGDLLTVYAHQFGYKELLSNAPNLWALPAAITGRAPPHVLFTLGYGLAACAVALYLWKAPRRTMDAALLAALLFPFVLPKMHERFFFLADMLSFAAAFADRRMVAVFVAVQAGSLLSLLAYGTDLAPLNVLGSLAMAFALYRTAMPGRSHQRHSPATSTGHSVQPGDPFDQGRAQPGARIEPSVGLDL
jgi:Gpi18-like mannosyltransferase